jgi:hypothetical protein
MTHFTTGDKVIMDNGTRGEIRGKAIGKDYYDVLPERSKSLADLQTKIAPERMRKIGKPKLVEV